MFRWFLIGALLLASTGAGLAQTGPAPGAGGPNPGADPGGSAAEDRVATGSVTRPSVGGTVQRAEAAVTRGGRLEFAIIVNSERADAAFAALEEAGAQLLRFRRLPRFDLRIGVFDLRDLERSDAEATLAEVDPEGILDANHLYRLAQDASPRTYARRLIDEAGDTCRLSASLRIGMIDGPVDVTHPALAPARIRQQDTLLPGQSAADTEHGTAVAGLIVGVDGGGIFSGFASGATLYAATAFARDRAGGGASADVDRIAAALDWLVATEAQVVNMSFAGPRNAVLDALLGRVAARGVVLVAAVGNDGRDEVAFPAASPDVIAVTAVDAALRPYQLANRGAGIDVAAPGVDLFVALGRGGGYVSGTSYAAPIVAALAARHLGARAGGAREVRQALRNSALELGEGRGDPRFGWGLVRAPTC